MIPDEMKKALEQPIDGVELRLAINMPAISGTKKQFPPIIIEAILQGRMIVARTPDGTVARAERTSAPGSPALYEITLANGQVIGERRYAALPARLQLAWAARYYLGLLARGLA